jgi:hypothetical protein
MLFFARNKLVYVCLKKTGTRFIFMSASSREINSVCLSEKDRCTFHIYECKDKNSFLKSNFFCVKNPKSPFFSG